MNAVLVNAVLANAVGANAVGAELPPGRRVRNMKDKQQRIFAAAQSLFDERGFGGVTTQAISERADIGAGTLFRYAASKTELLLMVYNEKLRVALECGVARAAAIADPVDAIVGLVSPLIELGRTDFEDGVTYQRELLFGAPGESYRRQGLTLIAGLEAEIAGLLSRQAEADGWPADPDAARLASSSIFAVTHLMVCRRSTGAHANHAPFDDLRVQIRQIVAGYFAVLREAASRGAAATAPVARG